MLMAEPASPPPAPVKRAVAPPQPTPIPAPSSPLAMVPAVGASTAALGEAATTRATEDPPPRPAAPVRAERPARAGAPAARERITPAAAHSEASKPQPAAAPPFAAESAATVAVAAPAPQPAEQAPARPSVPTALVVLAISPWGEVYVNGKAMGVSPPLTELELPRGKHRIVVRNGRFKPFEEDYELGSNQTVKIKHKFTQR
jgi:serine/threonine-protein kinase